MVLGGTPGGDNQMPWNAQMLHRILGGGWEPGSLVTEPRWGWDLDSDDVLVEEGSAQEDVGELRSRTTVRVVPRWGLRSGQHVVVCPGQQEPIVAAVDPRTGGAAVGV
jgi:gamma-glutamyltranspeptidase/glutathione hydrolase